MSDDCTCDEFCCQCWRKLYVTRWYISGAAFGNGGPFCSQRCMEASQDQGRGTSQFQRHLTTGVEP
jgi:hypothetical protein